MKYDRQEIERALSMPHLVEFVRSHALALPTLVKFAAVMALIIWVPRLSRRVGVPGVIGLLVAGIVIGPYGLDMGGINRPIFDFFGELGKLLLMYCAGLEIDLEPFRRAQSRVITFGILTTVIPLLLGMGVGFLFGYRPVAAVVLGSLLASHTLLAAPIVAKAGAIRLESVAVTYGATIISDTLSLVVFAVCVSTFQKGFSPSELLVQIVEIGIFIPFVLLGLSRCGRYFLAKVSDDEGGYFSLLFLIMAVAAVLASVVQLPDIVGAFLAGLAVNATVHDQPAKEKVKFLGEALFVPCFFVVTGFLIDPPKFWHSLVDNFGLASSVTIALVAGKWIAAEVAGRAFGYSRLERTTAWSLTLPQVAATLAATLVAYNTFNPAGERLLNEDLLNVVLVLMFTTSLLGPTLTERFIPRIVPRLSPAKAA
jgi:Kef-type K+ transport system membrane component KefB